MLLDPLLLLYRLVFNSNLRFGTFLSCYCYYFGILWFPLLFLTLDCLILVSRMVIALFTNLCSECHLPNQYYGLTFLKDSQKLVNQLCFFNFSFLIKLMSPVNFHFQYYSLWWFHWCIADRTAPDLSHFLILFDLGQVITIWRGIFLFTFYSLYLSQISFYQLLLII